MKKMWQKLFGLTLSGMLILSFSACAKLDVIGEGSVVSFSALLDAIPESVAEDSQNGGWQLTAPDESAHFFWSTDFSKSTQDVFLEVAAQPFLDAGLDPEKLPSYSVLQDGWIRFAADLGSDASVYTEAVTPAASYRELTRLYRESIGYHMAMDHFGINLGNGNQFEWAKDMAENDNDIVFVLDPEPFLKAGVDLSAIEGWNLAEVPVHVDGKDTTAKKLLKPFSVPQ